MLEQERAEAVDPVVDAAQAQGDARRSRSTGRFLGCSDMLEF